MRSAKKFGGGPLAKDHDANVYEPERTHTSHEKDKQKTTQKQFFSSLTATKPSGKGETTFQKSPCLALLLTILSTPPLTYSTTSQNSHSHAYQGLVLLAFWFAICFVWFRVVFCLLNTLYVVLWVCTDFSTTEHPCAACLYVCFAHGSSRCVI